MLRFIRKIAAVFSRIGAQTVTVYNVRGVGVPSVKRSAPVWSGGSPGCRHWGEVPYRREEDASVNMPLASSIHRKETGYDCQDCGARLVLRSETVSFP